MQQGQRGRGQGSSAADQFLLSAGRRRRIRRGVRQPGHGQYGPGGRLQRYVKCGPTPSRTSRHRRLLLFRRHRVDRSTDDRRRHDRPKHSLRRRVYTQQKRRTTNTRAHRNNGIATLTPADCARRRRSRSGSRSPARRARACARRYIHRASRHVPRARVVRGSPLPSTMAGRSPHSRPAGVQTRRDDTQTAGSRFFFSFFLL